MARAIGPWVARESGAEQLARLLTEGDRSALPTEPMPAPVAAAVDAGAQAYVAQLQQQIAQAQAEIGARQQALDALVRLDAAERARLHAEAQVRALVAQAMQRQEAARRELEEIDMAYILAALMEEA